jgi:hypothetical protein
MEVIIGVVLLLGAYALGWVNGNNNGVKGQSAKSVPVWPDTQD